jgi:CDP-paratose 2-epimerase
MNYVSTPRFDMPVLITGGAGFIGSNLAARLASEGYRVRLFDNLSRSGVEQNLRWLLNENGEQIEFIRGDVRDEEALTKAVWGCGIVYHFAAQVAVTTSLHSPADDFEVNARGTLNVLETIRRQKHPPDLIFTSTNKVYGSLRDLPLREHGDCYKGTDYRFPGIDEKQPLDFHSPYGCSKGAADQYVRDYVRSYGLRTLIFRMSCIYGPHQFGNEDQGWIAHFIIQALKKKPIILYGNGKQVRDALYVDDVIRAFRTGHRNIDRLAGSVFNIGGGSANAVSLLQLIDLIQELMGIELVVRFAENREGDQRYFVSDISQFSQRTGWQPQTNLKDGVKRLYLWLLENYAKSRDLLRTLVVK